MSNSWREASMTRRATIRVGVNAGAGGGAAWGAQNEWGVAKTWRTRGSKCESGLVG